MKAIGLTGNIGAGKSTVARLLEERGAEVLDADVLVHGLLHEGGDAVLDVLAAFPTAAASDGRSVDRRALGRIVFADSDARRRLEAILHPMVREREMAWLDACRGKGARLAVVEATLLVEAARTAGRDPREGFDALVVVTCDEDELLRRAVARAVAAGAAPVEAERDARARLLAQMPQSQKAAAADVVLDNTRGREHLEAQVDRLVASLEETTP